MSAASEPTPDAVPPPARGATFALLAAVVLVHLPAMGRYGWFRDELYYVSCAKRLAWGYVDQPPLSIALLAAWLARRLGGGAFAQALAGVGVLASLVYLGMDHYYSMNALDPVLWAGA